MWVISRLAGRLEMLVRVLLLVVLLGFGSWAPAQVDRATLAGRVSDSTGAVVQGAKVELVSQETGLRRVVQTTETGAYTFSLVPIGVYTVTATQAGFRPVAMKELRLGVGDTRTLDITMEVST